MKKEILKQAAAQLRSLKEEVENYRENEVIEKKARHIIIKLAQSNKITSVEDAFKKMSELSTKSVVDLSVIEKAIELQKNGQMLGTLADEKPDTELFDPLTSMLLEDYI
jgi:signal-transduction protein with cAMP-binding, CBS, and nucleotidyltransferase domain